MSELQRITTQYIDDEDRIRLSGEDSDGNALVLWLTQRLAGRLLPHVCAWLERQTMLPENDLDSYAAAAQAEMIQSFAQQAAVVALEPQTPVPARAQSGAWLVRSVDITISDGGVTLTFKAADGEGMIPATLALHDQSLRQWLSILYSQYVAAQWPLAGWPEWIAPSAPDRSARHGAVLH